MRRNNALTLAAALIFAPLAQADEIDPPAPQAAMDAFALVDGWIRDWDVPAASPENEIVPIHAACVTLRLDGEVVARGLESDIVPDQSTVWSAASAAFRAANARLPADRDAIWEQRVADEAARMTITLEMSGALIPLAETEVAEAAVRLRPGIDGIAVRRGEQLVAEFPESMLARGADAVQAIAAAVTEISGDGGTALSTVQELAADGYTFYRFRTVTIAQPAEKLAGVFVHRGGRVIGSGEVTVPALRAFADGMAAHLVRRAWPGVEAYGLSGDYDPVVGRSEPRVAPTIDQAMAVYALLRYAETPRVDGQTARRARRTAHRTLEALAEVEVGEFEPWSNAIDAAACLIALSQVPENDVASEPALALLHQRCTATFEGAYEDGTGFDPAIPQPAQGLIAWALVKTASSDEAISLASAAVRTVFRETPPGLLVSQMPYLGWAELDLASDPSSEIPAATALVSMRDMVWEFQLSASDLEYEDRDLAGGVIFTKGATPLPTWQTLRPIAFIASMLGDERLTPGTATTGQVPSEIIRLASSYRFARQLAAGAEEARMYRRPDRAIDGVRASLWDQTMPTNATVLALLAVVEGLDSYAQIGARVKLEPIPILERPEG